MRRVVANNIAASAIACELFYECTLDGPRLREIAEGALGWCGDMGSPHYFDHYPVGWRWT